MSSTTTYQPSHKLNVTFRGYKKGHTATLIVHKRKGHGYIVGYGGGSQELGRTMKDLKANLDASIKKGGGLAGLGPVDTFTFEKIK